MGKLNACGRIVQITFLIINVLFLLVGIAITAGGSYLIAKGDDLSFFTGSHTFSGAALIVAAGVFTMIVTAVGIVGGLFKLKIVLGIYAVVVAFVVLLEIVAAILGFIFRNNVENRATENAVDAINDYRPLNNPEYQEDVNKAIDFIQENFECCGWNETDYWLQTIYFDLTGEFPESCTCDKSGSGSGSGSGGEPGSSEGCRTLENGQVVYEKTCQTGVVDRLRQYAAAVGAIGIVFGIVEVVAIVLAAGLIYCLVKGQEYTTV